MQSITKKCPHCGFNMTKNYCIKCGYYEGKSVSNINQYTEKVDDLQLLLKDEHLKIIHQKNLGLLFILGPLYFGYYHCFMLSIMGIILEFSISWVLGMSHDGSNLIIIFFLLINRILYVLFGNIILLKTLNRYVTKIKEKKANKYQEILFYRAPKSILYLMLVTGIYIMILSLWLLIYTTYW